MGGVTPYLPPSQAAHRIPLLSLTLIKPRPTDLHSSRHLSSHQQQGQQCWLITLTLHRITSIKIQLQIPYRNCCCHLHHLLNFWALPIPEEGGWVKMTYVSLPPRQTIGLLRTVTRLTRGQMNGQRGQMEGHRGAKGRLTWSRKDLRGLRGAAPKNADAAYSRVACHSF